MKEHGPEWKYVIILSSFRRILLCTKSQTAKCKHRLIVARIVRLIGDWNFIEVQDFVIHWFEKRWPVTIEKSFHAIGSASSCCRSAWSSSSALILITPAAGSGMSSSYHRPAFISSCCIRPLEQFGSWYSVIRLPDRFLPQTKGILVHQSFPDI